MLDASKSALLVIDVQGKLAQLMHDKERVFENIQRMVKGARALELPIIWTEQYPEGLGLTIPEIAQLLVDQKPVIKNTFSCFGNDEFAAHLQELGRKQILLTGIETHVCVYQTAADLTQKDFRVEVIVDAVSSRTPENKQIGLDRMKDMGVWWNTTEMALFELLRIAEGKKFKEILRIVK